MTLHESLMRNSISSTPSPGLSAEQFCNQWAQWPSSPIDGDYWAGEMHPVSTLRAANDGGESNCESDGVWGTLDSCRTIKRVLNAWNPDFFTHPMLWKLTYDHPMNVVTMTTRHLRTSLGRPSPSQDTVVNTVLCRSSAPLAADAVSCLIWPLMDVWLISLFCFGLGFGRQYLIYYKERVILFLPTLIVFYIISYYMYFRLHI